MQTYHLDFTIKRGNIRLDLSELPGLRGLLKATDELIIHGRRRINVNGKDKTLTDELIFHGRRKIDVNGKDKTLTG